MPCQFHHLLPCSCINFAAQKAAGVTHLEEPADVGNELQIKQSIFEILSEDIAEEQVTTQ